MYRAEWKNVTLFFMQLFIREYQPEDRAALIECLQGLQGFIHALDPLERVRGITDFDAESYTDTLLRGVLAKEGLIHLAEVEQCVVGCVASWIIPADDEDLLGHYPSRTGRVVELFVSQDVRGGGVGKALMETAEDHLRKVGCDSVRVEVFSGNDAHQFYIKLGYTDRCVDMIKML